MSPEMIAEFHREALRVMLSYLQHRGIGTVAQLNAVRGKKLIEEPLWKLLELNGKYGGCYISEGVKLVEDRVGAQVSASAGTWSSRRLERILGPVPGGRGWRSWCDSPEYSCNLEHVAERRTIVAALLNSPESLDLILDSYLLGCVILKSEHVRLAPGALEIGDPWKRYRQASPQVRVWSRDLGDWIELAPR